MSEQQSDNWIQRNVPGGLNSIQAANSFEVL